MEETDAIGSLAALAHSVRLKVFRALVVAGHAGMTPGTMAEGLAMPSTSLSFHLKELAHSGLVTQERAGRHLIYRADFEHMNALLGYLTENCCRGTECTVDASPVACC